MRTAKRRGHGICTTLLKVPLKSSVIHRLSSLPITVLVKHISINTNTVRPSLSTREVNYNAKSDIVYITGELANLAFHVDDYDLARKYAQESLSIADSSKLTDDKAVTESPMVGIALSYSALGSYYRQRGNYDSAIAFYRRALDTYESLYNMTREYVDNSVECLTDVGRTYRLAGDYEKAIETYLVSLERSENLPRSKQVVRAGIFNSLGILYEEQGDYQKAIDFFDFSLRSFRIIKDRGEEARVLSNLAATHQKLGEAERALTEYRESLRIAEEIENREVMATATQGLGWVMREKGNYEEARKWFET